MKLMDWRKSQDLSRAWVARRCGRHYETIRRWELGKRIPHANDARAIFELTDGLVTPNDFHGVAKE